jgi:hypothetical protein
VPGVDGGGIDILFPPGAGKPTAAAAPEKAAGQVDHEGDRGSERADRHAGAQREQDPANC